MKVWPTQRLVRGLACWAAAAIAAVLWPPLAPALWAALALGAALVVQDAVALARRPPPRIARTVPERAFEGQPCELRVEIEGRAPQPVELVVIEELPRDVAPAEPRFEGVRVAPGGRVALPVRVRPARRGDRTLGPTVALERSPLGLLVRRVVAPAAAPLRVHPDASRFLRREALDPRRLPAELGVRPSRRRGEGTDFESLREYVAGDDPRRVDWPATARRGRLVVRQHQHERNHTVLLALDASRLMAARVGARSKLDAGVDAALALGHAALAMRDRVGLVVFDRSVRAHLAPRAGRAAFGALLDVLRPVEPALVEADHAALVRELAVRQRQRALVVVLSDFVEAEGAGGLAPLAVLARRHRVLFVALRDPVLGELEAGAAGGGLYRRLALDDLLQTREEALAALRLEGVPSLDLPPERVTAPVLGRYLALREAWQG